MRRGKEMRKLGVKGNGGGEEMTGEYKRGGREERKNKQWRKGMNKGGEEKRGMTETKEKKGKYVVGGRSRKEEIML